MLYKVELRQNSAYIGEIRANALFGSFLTAYSYFVDLDDEKIRDIVLSDLFIKERYPIGISNNEVLYNKTASTRKTFDVSRTRIGRFNDITDVELNKAECIFVGNAEFFISTSLDKDTLSTIINLMLTGGLGKWRSVGYGQFDLVSVEEYKVSTEAMKYVTLSNFSPSEEELKLVDVTGYEVRNAITTSGKQQATISLLKTGTLLKRGTDFIGSHIYDAESDTYIHGKSIVLGVN